MEMTKGRLTTLRRWALYRRAILGPLEKNLKGKNLNEKPEEILLVAATLHVIIEALTETVRRMGNDYPVEDMEDWIEAVRPLADGYVDITADKLVTTITKPIKDLPFRYPVKGETV